MYKCKCELNVTKQNNKNISYSKMHRYLKSVTKNKTNIHYTALFFTINHKYIQYLFNNII